MDHISPLWTWHTPHTGSYNLLWQCWSYISLCQSCVPLKDETCSLGLSLHQTSNSIRHSSCGTHLNQGSTGGCHDQTALMAPLHKLFHKIGVAKPPPSWGGVLRINHHIDWFRNHCVYSHHIFFHLMYSQHPSLAPFIYLLCVSSCHDSFYIYNFLHWVLHRIMVTEFWVVFVPTW